MSDTRGLLDRITAFRKRLEGDSFAGPDAVAVESGEIVPVVNEVECLRAQLRQIVPPEVDEGPPLPQLTDRARRLLTEAKGLVERQWNFSADSLFAMIAAEGTDPLAQYHVDTVAVLDSAVRLGQTLPDSPSAQLKQCTGLEGLLGVIRERLAIQERALGRRKTDADRIDRLASVYVAMHAGSPVGLTAVATLAEEILDDSRHARPLRFVHAAVDSTRAYPEAAGFPAPARFVAAHAINVAQIVARLVSSDPEWASHPLLAVVAALLVDCGMMAIPVEVLTRAGGLTPAERRLVDGHAQAGAEMILRCFPEVAPLAAAVGAHHERTDGTGYPAGLRGTTAPALGRFLAVADVYAALNEPRPHRPARDGRAALTEVLLLAEHGMLDRTYAAHLVRLSFYPVGTVVELTDGRVGVVVANHPNPDDPRAPGRPVVAVLADADGTLLPHPEHVDLATADRGAILRAVPAAQRRELLGHRYPDLVEAFDMGNYFSATRHPWASLLFLAPLLAAYEGGLLWLGGDQADRMRNGADAWMRWGLDLFGAGHALAAPAVVLVVMVLWTWWRWADRPDDPLRLFFGIALESCLFACVLWEFSRNFGPIVDGLGLKLQITVRTAPLAHMLTFIGAGIYEEVLFRLGLFGGLFVLLRVVGLQRLLACLLASTVAALAFAAAHHVGPYGEPMRADYFLFRTLAGLYFTALFALRGFGVAVGAHAGYDVLVGVTIS